MCSGSYRDARTSDRSGDQDWDRLAAAAVVVARVVVR